MSTEHVLWQIQYKTEIKVVIITINKHFYGFSRIKSHKSNIPGFIHKQCQKIKT